MRFTAFLLVIFYVFAIILFGLVLSGIKSEIFFFYSLQKNLCPKCVIFSCPQNKVPKAIVDTYLERNPVMKEAWIEDGYRFD